MRGNLRDRPQFRNRCPLFPCRGSRGSFGGLAPPIESFPDLLRVPENDWNVPRGRLPHNLRIHGEVMVCDQIAHAPWSGPVGIRRGGLGFIGQFFDRLADHLEVEKDGVKEQLIGTEGLERLTLQKSADLLGAIDQIVEIQKSVTRHESGLFRRGAGRAA